MKRIVRMLLMTLFLVPLFPFFLFRSHGNIKYRLSGRTIIICNHYSNFDPFFIQMKFFRTRIRFVALKIPKHKIHLRVITWLFDCIYVDPDKVDLAFYKSAIKSLNQNQVMCIFPEGVVNPRKYGFFDFKQSYLRLAKKTNSTVLPMYLYPVLKPFKRSKLYIGQVIDIANDDRDYEVINYEVLSRLMDYQASLE